MAYSSIFNYVDDFFDDFDELFKDFNFSTPIVYCEKIGDNTKELAKDVSKNIVSSELPFNLVVDEDKNIAFYLACAGVRKDELSLTKKGRTFTITIAERKVNDNEKKQIVIHKGLKVPTSKTLVSTFTPIEKYDCDKAEVKFEDGLFMITVPVKEEEKAKEIKF